MKPQTLLVRDWFDLTASMDLMLLMIWLFAIVLVAVAYVLSKTTSLPSIQYRLVLPAFCHRHFWLCLMTIAIVLRLPMMFQAFWYDETFTGAMAQLPLDRFFVALSGDVHPPLAYLLAKLAGSIFGYSEFALRLPSLISGLLLIPAVYRLTHLISSDKNKARLSAILISTMPALIHYSNEARYPIILALSVIVAMIAIIEHRPGLYLIATLAVTLLHASGLLYASVLIFSAGRGFLKSSILICCAIVATILFMFSQSGDVANGFWLWSMLPLHHITEMTVLMPPPLLEILTYCAVIILTICSIPVFFKLKRNRILLLLVAMVPFFQFALNIVWHPVYLPRTLIASTIILLIAWSMIVFRKLIFQLLVIVAILPASLAMFRTEDSTNLKSLFSYCQGADLIYTPQTSMSVSAIYYARPGARLINYIDGNSINQSLPDHSRIALGFDFTAIESFQNVDVCMLVQWNDYVTNKVVKHAYNLRTKYQAKSAYFKVNPFNTYEVSRWRQ